MDPWVKKSVKNGLSKVNYGEIRLLIHEKEVVSIDTIERRRTRKSENLAGSGDPTGGVKNDQN